MAEYTKLDCLLGKAIRVHHNTREVREAREGKEERERERERERDKEREIDR
jgi:hypothetical protein